MSDTIELAATRAALDVMKAERNDIWEAYKKAVAQRERQERNLRNEIRVLHLRLRDANRAAERASKACYLLAGKVRESDAELAAEREGHARVIAALKDPNAVYVNILRGEIALTKRNALAYAGIDPTALETVTAERDAMHELLKNISSPTWDDARMDYVEVQIDKDTYQRMQHLIRGDGDV